MSHISNAQREAIVREAIAERDALLAGHDTRWTAMFKRRVAVEQLMLDSANGKRPMPTQQELREWALRLGGCNDAGPRS